MNGNQPLLTVYILTYNHEDFIGNAIESVICQETSYPFKIHILEDCSTDRTVEICKHYQARHPSLIELTAQPLNTRGSHSYEAQSKTVTDYFALLEGDDYWCHKHKIQIALDLLESEKDYTIFAHNTLYNYLDEGRQVSLVKEKNRRRISNPVTINNAPYLHTSSRIYRNVLDYGRRFRKRKYRGDVYVYYSYLEKGPLYYHDEIMSVYNIHSSGKWQSHSEKSKKKMIDRSWYRRNTLLGYRHDELFTGKVRYSIVLRKLKVVFGKRLGWMVYARYSAFRSTRELGRVSKSV